MWRWTGRPVDRYPFEAAAKYTTIVDLSQSAPAAYWRSEVARIGAALRWEVKAFGDRDASDYVSSKHLLRPFGRTDLRRERLDGDGRAQHWRFRIAARSRYASIILDARLREVAGPSSRVIDGNKEPPPLNDLWQRAFVPVVPPDILKPPGLRVMVPLTAGLLGDDDDELKPPPLLAALDDAWFDVGGVAEQLVADIDEVPDVPLGGGQRASLQEFGPDPVRTRRGWGGGNPFKPGEFVAARPAGPIGYTYDEGGSAPRFAHSSFAIELATPMGSSDTIRDWSFVKLSLRRLLVPEALAGYAGPNTDLDPNTSVEYRCEAGGAPGFVDIDVDPSGTQSLDLAVVLRITDADHAVGSIGPIESKANLRMTVERLAVGEVAEKPGKWRETWRIDVFDRANPATPSIRPIRWIRTFTVPVDPDVTAPGADTTAPDEVGTVTPGASAASLRITCRERSGRMNAPVKVSVPMRPYHISRPTPAKWAQLAADASRFAEVDASGIPKPKSHVSAEEILFVEEDGRWRIRRANGEEARLVPYDPPDADSQLSTELWAVATERIRDAGRREAERYLALFRIEPGQSVLEPIHPEMRTPAPGGANIVFRILEVERRRTPAGATREGVVERIADDGAVDGQAVDGWALLWPPLPKDGETDDAPIKDDALGRLVKVSRPIPARVAVQA
jgi:hypothetical protein